MAKKILVTSGTGFIDSHIVDALIEKDYDVIIYDNLCPQVHKNGKKPKYLNKNAKFIKGDVLDYDKLKKVILQVNAIFHKAAMVGVGQSQYEIRKYTEVNELGTANLLDIIVNNKNKIEKIIVAASMSSYGEGAYICKKHGRLRPPLRSNEQMLEKKWELYCPHCGKELTPTAVTEDDRQNCNSIYAINKKTQEEMVMNICQTYNIPGVALRYFNVYGPRQSLSNPYTGVAAIFMSRIKNNKSPIIFEDGRQSRDFISVYDIARANILALENSKADYQIFNVGTGQPLQIKQIAEILAKLYGKDIKPEILNKFRKGDVRHCFADISKIEKTLGFKIKYSFEEGMKNLIEWAHTADADDLVDNAINELKKHKLTL
ncbi:MAG TPA: GDP-mannose 4,6-dehydratase [bacterium]|nr:GDP-mannose 4,6-dehydratase [bacterium]